MVLEYELLTSVSYCANGPITKLSEWVQITLPIVISAVVSVRDLATGDRYTYSVYLLPVVTDVCVDLIAEVVLCFYSVICREKCV